MQTTLPTPEALAREFATVLSEWLTPDEMREAVELNRTEAHPDVCHSHDHCDANEAMAEALSRFGVEMDVQTEAHRTLWNAAWSIAMAAEFWMA